MLTWLRWLMAAPFLLLLVLFVLSNTQTVTLRLWPTDLALPIPLAIAVLGGMAIGLLAGALMLWFGKLAARHAAARAQARIAALEAQLRQPQPTAPANALPSPT